jgi:hypothetical protein
MATTLAHLLDFRKRKCGPKILALPRLGYRTVELIDLLEGKAFSFIDHEVNECNADEAEGAPDEEDFGLQVGMRGVNHVRRAVSDGLVGLLENAHIECSSLSNLRITRGNREKGRGKRKVSLLTQFNNQLLAVVILKHLALTFNGNSSPVTTHATGPQLLAKKKM